MTRAKCAECVSCLIATRAALSRKMQQSWQMASAYWKVSLFRKPCQTLRYRLRQCLEKNHPSLSRTQVLGDGTSLLLQNEPIVKFSSPFTSDRVHQRWRPCRQLSQSISSFSQWGFESPSCFFGLF